MAGADPAALRRLAISSVRAWTTLLSLTTWVHARARVEAVVARRMWTPCGAALAQVCPFTSGTRGMISLLTVVGWSP